MAKKCELTRNDDFVLHDKRLSLVGRSIGELLSEDARPRVVTAYVKICSLRFIPGDEIYGGYLFSLFISESSKSSI